MGLLRAFRETARSEGEKVEAPSPSSLRFSSALEHTQAVMREEEASRMPINDTAMEEPQFFQTPQERQEERLDTLPSAPQGVPVSGQPPAQQQPFNQQFRQQLQSIEEMGRGPQPMEPVPPDGPLPETPEEELPDVVGVRATPKETVTLETFMLPHLKKSEAFRPDAYYATKEEKKKGIVTIGYGQTGVAKIGDTITREEAERLLQKRFLEGKKRLSKGIEGYDALPMRVKAAFNDLEYNGGFDLIGPKARAAIKEGNVEEALLQTLDTANQSGKTMLGLAKRRAEAYNWGAKDKIAEVEQLDNGTIIYRREDGSEVFRYRNPRHGNSNAGVVRIN